ncbi:TonB-dependent receptor [Flavobacteriaceae bacterium S0862]|nr:TonB-dependent receptor [Flavobacteriaceae bacterium S0862]
MKKNTLIFLLGVFLVSTAFAQQTIIKGSVKDAVTNLPIPEVTITIEETSYSTKTDAKGEFSFTRNVPLGEQVLNVSKQGYITARYPIVVNEGSTVNITDMFLKIDVSDSADLFTINLSDDELNDDTSGADNISGLLQSSQDVFLRTAAFEFGSSFFRVRGLDSENGTILINGVEMNKMFNGRPQWSNWGGLNDAMRNQEFTNGIPPSAYNFGGILGTTNINVRASQYRKGGRITYSSSNRSYTNRMMASYASGLVEGGWAYSMSLGRRWGNEGFQDGTFYDANSFFMSVEKLINDKHSINVTGIYAPNRRGKSSANTQEVYDLKDIRYNEYWGWQDGEKRNSRVKRTDEPIIMLNHYWNISEKTTLNSNLAYQFGELGNSRLDYAGGANPSPAYYQNLPSYWVSRDDLENAYEFEQDFISKGQINWNRIYDANITNNTSGNNAAYVLYEDRSDDTQFTANTIFNTEISDNITLNGALNLRQLKSENFAQITDMLGSTTGYLNVDSFDGYQYDLRNPDRVVGEGDKLRYNYNLHADVFSAHVQAVFKYNKIDFYLAGNITNTQYQREGLYQHEAYEDNSFGKGEKLKFNGLGAKGGFTYKLTGKHLFDVNAAYISKAPSLRNTFSNSRENHSVVGDRSGVDITEEKIMSADASYIFRSPIVKARLTGYYTTIKDANEISFFFADGVGGDNTAFVQEILQGVNKKHFGGELGIEVQVTPTIKLKGAASIGQYTYDNNPNLILTSDDFDNGFQDFEEANLKDYKIAGGPQRASSVGFEYRDPDYWWFGATANFFSNAYVDISPLTRTQNFYLDNDGLPFNDYDPALARELLKQEKFDSYMTVNAIGGKSWKIGDYFIGLFASVNNLLDKEYKTGGFEQGRNANFRELRDDNANPKRVFGPKYWYGRGTTYFLNLNFRF